MRFPTKARLALAALALTASQGAHAIVADKFVCQISITDGDGRSMQQKTDLFIARLPLSSSPSPDVRLTAATHLTTAELETPQAKTRANLKIDYTHAVKIDSNGHAMQAKQHSCITLTVNICPKRNGSGVQLCQDMMLACFQPDDPFGSDPMQGWTTVGITPDGTPSFDEQRPISYAETVTDDTGAHRATVVASCQYRGTYQ